jgi:tRNA (guanine37-N1)-methyltransferase
MRIDIVTIHPGLLEGPFAHSIVKRAIDKGLADVQLVNLRDFSTSKHRQVDDYAFGGGAGMVMMMEPIDRCITHLQQERTYDEVIFLTPDGAPFTQRLANRLSTCTNLLLLCGHYKGIDERAREKFITREVSIGDYVLSGGELAAAVVADAVIRLIPGVLNDETSALSDSFQDDLLSSPVYTRPSDYKGMKVPEVLLSGDPLKIEEWRHEQALLRTRARRPDLLQGEQGE